MRRWITYLAGLFCLFIVFGLAPVNVLADDDTTVYISVEKFTLGQGYIVKPKKVLVEPGTKVSDIVEKVLSQEGYEPDIEIDSSYGWYLAGIYNADNGRSHVPVSIMKLDSYGFFPDYPTGRLPSTENLLYPELSQFSYQTEGTTSGWFYYVNNYGPAYGMSFYTVEDQDVIRIQFTLCMGDLNKVGNIDVAVKSLAIIKEYLEKESKDDEIISIYDKSLEMVSDMDANREDIQQLQIYLQEIAEDLSDGSKDLSYPALLANITSLFDKTKACDVGCRISMLSDEVTVDDGIIIEDVYEQYTKLTGEQQKLINPESQELLNSVWNQWCILRKEIEDRKAADTVIEQINAIGTVTMSREALITAARKAYNALNAEAKAMVPSTVLSKLTAAEKKIATLKKEAEVKKYTPAKVKISKISSKKKKVRLTWKKITSASGYEIQMSSKKSSGFKKVALIKMAKTTTYTKKKLKSKKTMYFRVRAYRTVGKTTYYGAYSAVKKVKVK